VSRVPCAKDKFCTVQTIRRPQRKHPRLVVLHWQLLIPKKCSHPVVKPEASGRPLRVKQPYVDPCISDFAPQLLSVFLTSASASGRLNNTLLTYYVQSAVKVIVQSPSSRVWRRLRQSTQSWSVHVSFHLLRYRFCPTSCCHALPICLASECTKKTTTSSTHLRNLSAIVAGHIIRTASQKVLGRHRRQATLP